jgi:hypothetical protein
VKAKTIDLTDIAKIQDRLRTSPSRPKTRVRYIKAIELLASEIHAMRSNGYGWSDIAAVLTESGLEVSATTIRTYLGRVTSEPSRPRQGHPRDVANPSALTSQAPSSQNPDHRPRLRFATRPRESTGYPSHRLRPDRRRSTRASRRRQRRVPWIRKRRQVGRSLYVPTRPISESKRRCIDGLSTAASTSP